MDETRRKALLFGASMLAPLAAVGAVNRARLADQDGQAGQDASTRSANLGEAEFVQAGNGAVQRKMLEKLRETVSVTDFGAVGDGRTDNSSAVQAAIAHVVARGGGVVHFPAGTFRCNLTLGSGVILQGAGMHETVLRPAVRDHLIKTRLDKSTVRSGIRDLGLVGERSHSGCNGVHLESASARTWCDTIGLENVHISDCGGAGIYARGTASVGPFIQRLKLSNCEIRKNVGRCMQLVGCVLETSAIHCSFAGDAAKGGVNVVSLEFNPERGGSYPARVSFYSSIFSAFESHPKAFAPAVWIGAGSQIGFYNCSFEYCDPAIFTDQAPFANGFMALGCAFTFSEPTRDAIWLKRSEVTVIEGCSFLSAAGLTNAIHFSDGAGMTDIKRVQIGSNHLGGGVENYVKDASSFYQQLVGGALIYCRDYMVILGENARLDVLTTIKADNGSTTQFAPGAEATLVPFVGFENVRIKHNAGNILLRDSADYGLDAPQKSITLRWNGQRAKWIETNRS